VIHGTLLNAKRTCGTLLVFAAAILCACGGPKKPDPGAGARLFGARASQAFAQGNLAGALSDYKKAYVAAARADLPQQQAQYLFNIGRVYYEMGVLDSAEAMFENARREFVFCRDPGNAAFAAGFMALAYCHRGMYKNAFEWYQRGRPEKLADRRAAAFWLTVQALLAMMNERIPEAEGYLDKAMEACRKEKMHNAMAQIDYYRAAIAFSAARYHDAQGRLDASLASLDKAVERYRRWRVLLAAATVSFCLSDEENGQRFFRRAADCAPAGIEIPAADSIRFCPRRFWEGWR
jgi:tetratricopeptide (TPR) repeat protein